MEINSLPLRLILSDSPSQKQETLNNTLLKDKISKADKKNCPNQQDQVQGEERENNEKVRYSGSHLQSHSLEESHSLQADAEGQSPVRRQPGSQRKMMSQNKSQQETHR